MFLESFLVMAFPALVALAGAFDALTMTIPNRLNLALGLLFPLAALAAGLPADVFLTHVATGAAMLVVGFALFAPGWIGGGDAKFFAVCGLWLGFDPLLNFALIASVLGGVLTMGALAARQVVLPAPLAAQRWTVWLRDPTAGVPYGLALAAAALLIWPETLWLKALLR